MTRRTRLLLIPLAVLLVAAGVVVLVVHAPGARQPEAAAALDAAPGADLVFPDGHLLDRIARVNPPNTRASTSTWYGTDATDGQITAFYDAQLLPLGYTAAALDKVPNPTDPGDPMRELRKYTRGAYTYTVLVAPLPRRVGGRSIQSGYRQFLLTRLGVD